MPQFAFCSQRRLICVVCCLQCHANGAQAPGGTRPDIYESEVQAMKAASNEIMAMNAVIQCKVCALFCRPSRLVLARAKCVLVQLPCFARLERTVLFCRP